MGELNITTKIMLLPVFLLLLIGSVVAVQITDASMTWMDEKILYISSNNPIPAMLKFSFKETTNQAPIQSIVIDAHEMHQDIRMQQYYQSISMSQNSCKNINSTYTCSVSRTTNGQPLTLKITNTPVNVNFRFFHEGGNITEINKTFTFAFDNTRPLLKFIGTENCYTDGVCYGAAGMPNKIVINFEDAQATFNRKLVAFRLGTEDSIVHECTGLSCYGYASPVCDTARQIPLNVIYYRNVPSQDDAGNPVEQKESNSIMCDPDKPVITAKKVSSSSGLEAITTKDNIILTVNVTEPTSPKLNFTINASQIGLTSIVQGSCNKMTNSFVCTASLKPTITSGGTFNLNFQISDLAGNRVFDQASVQLLVTDEQEVVDFWNVKSVTPDTRNINVKNLIYDRDFNYEVQLTKKSGDPKIIEIKLDTKCVPTKENITGNRGDITSLKFIASNSSNNKFYAKVTLKDYNSMENNRYKKFTSLEYNCEASILTKNGDFLFTTPEKQNFTIKFGLVYENNFKDFYINELNSTKESIESRKKLIDFYSKTVGLVVTGCEAASALDKIMGAQGMVTQALTNMAVYLSPALLGTPAGPAIENELANKGATEASQRLSTFLGEVCAFLTCSSDSVLIPQNHLNEFWDTTATESIPFSDEIQSFSGGFPNYSSSLSPYKSEFIAWSSLCIPAIIYHQEVRQGINCAYAECLAFGVGKLGKDVASCQEEKSYSECIMLSQGITNFIPFTAMFKEATATLSEIFKDPVTLFGTTGVTAYCSVILPLTPGWGTGACNAVVSFNQMNELISQVMRIKNRPNANTASCSTVNQYLDPNTLKWMTLPPSMQANELGLKNPEEMKVNIQSGGKTYTMEYGMVNIGNNIWIDARQLPPSGTVDFKKVHVYYGERGGALQYQGNFFDVLQVLDSEGFFSPSGQGGTNQGLPPESTQNQVSEQDFKKLLQEIIKNEGKSTLDVKSGVYVTTNEKGEIIYSSSPYGQLSPLANIESLKALVETAQLSPGAYQYFKENLVKQYEALDSQLQPFDSNKKYSSMLKEYFDELDKNYAAIHEKENDVLVKTKSLNKLNSEVEDLRKQVLSGVGDPNELAKKEEELIKETKELNEAKKGLKEAQEKAKESVENIEGLEGEVEDMNKWKTFWGSASSAVRNFYSLGRQISTIRNVLGVSFGRWSSDGFGGTMTEISNAFDEASNFERAWCEIEKGSISSKSGSAIIQRLGQGVYASGAFINARKYSQQEYGSGLTKHSYWISGAVSSGKKPGLTFIVTVSGNSGKKDITQDLSGSAIISLPINQKYAFSGSGTYFFESEMDYDEVCIEFKNSQGELRQFFDDVTGLDDGKFCSTIIGEI